MSSPIIFIFLPLFAPAVMYFFSKSYRRKSLFLLTIACSLSGTGWACVSSIWQTPKFISLTWSSTPLFFVDPLSGLISSMVLLVGGFTIQYSARYLESDPQREHFLGNMAAVLFCILILLFAQNLLLVIGAWIASSFFLHRLLIHFKERPRALLAAHQKFWVSRCGDLCLAFSIFLLYSEFQTLDLKSILQDIHSSELTLNLEISMLFLALAALVKSAAIPFQFWLPKSMDAPTPVSALMHAGIVNSGGYLLVRFSPLLGSSTIAPILLTAAGALSTLWGGLIMLTQTDIKRQLAYSTVTQMGLMLLQCGLGAFSIATLHIIGHAIYKAYAFLSSGVSVEVSLFKRATGQLSDQRIAPWSQLFALLIALLHVYVLVTLFSIDFTLKAGAVVLIAILTLAMAQVMVAGALRFISIAISFGIGLIYFSSYLLFERVLQDSIGTISTSNTALLAPMSVAIALLSLILFLFQNNIKSLSHKPFFVKRYVALMNGLG